MNPHSRSKIISWHNQIFLKDPYCLDFAKTGWKRILFPCQGNFDLFELYNIFLLAIEAGDKTMFLTDYEEAPGHSEVEEIELCASSYLKALTGVKGSLYARIFGQSLRWGGILTRDYVTLVGGEGILIDKLVARLGGEQMIKERFFEQCDAHWLCDDANRHFLNDMGWNDIDS